MDISKYFFPFFEKELKLAITTLELQIDHSLLDPLLQDSSDENEESEESEEILKTYREQFGNLKMKYRCKDCIDRRTGKKKSWTVS